MVGEKVKIVLVDDHTLFRTGLRGLLSQCESYDVVGDFGSGEEFLATLPTLAVDVVFMDISMPGMDGFELCRELRKRSSTLGIIMLTAHFRIKLAVTKCRTNATNLICRHRDTDARTATRMPR